MIKPCEEASIMGSLLSTLELCLLIFEDTKKIRKSNPTTLSEYIYVLLGKRTSLFSTKQFVFLHFYMESCM